ncbi:Alpha/Beta hydrolase protein [Syncephalis fuscata]|nr:Alpha/Beta hydrolase protein [Syncephalis fuscata]
MTMTIPGAVQRTCQVAADRASRPLKIVYELHGAGEEHVMFVGGLGDTRHLWLPQVAFLVQHGYQVCVFDNRGAGDSDTPDELYTISEMAKDTVELLNHIGWTSNVHLIGGSMGGVISQELASEFPKYFSTVCFACTFSNPDDPKNQVVFNSLRSDLPIEPNQRQEHLYSIIFPQEWLDAPSNYDPTKTNHEFLRAVCGAKSHPANYEKQNKGFMGQIVAASARCITDEKLLKIQKSDYRVMVMVGDKDTLIQPFNSEYLAEKTQASLKVFEGQTILEFIRGSSV